MKNEAPSDPSILFALPYVGATVLYQRRDNPGDAREPVEYSPRAAIVSDVHGDGTVDLLVACHGQDRTRLAMGKGLWTFKGGVRHASRCETDARWWTWPHASTSSIS